MRDHQSPRARPHWNPGRGTYPPANGDALRGAIQWGVFRDSADPSRYVEIFLVESWVEHLRQHERGTVADQAVEGQIRAFHLGDTPPQVSHFIYAHR